MKRKEMLARLKKGEDPLELAIQKWKDIVEGKGKDLQDDNCALCETCGNCSECLVYEETGKTDCEGTPYILYSDAEVEEASKKNLRALAIAELEFLKALRKKEG